MKTTDWYPGTVKPAYVGVYQRKVPDGSFLYSYFDGIKFMWLCTSANSADEHTNFASWWQDIPWRGLTEPHCLKCGTEMVKSTALVAIYSGIPDFPGSEVVTVSPRGNARLIDCYKCPACGWSIT